MGKSAPDLSESDKAAHASLDRGATEARVRAFEAAGSLVPAGAHAPSGIGESGVRGRSIRGGSQGEASLPVEGLSAGARWGNPQEAG
ncbi:MAG: hypothetical protein QXU81_11105 [Candidatus Bathyarchaeia archaeon]